MAIQASEGLCTRIPKLRSRPCGIMERRLYLIHAFKIWVLSVDSQHANEYVNHIVACLLTRFARARRSRSLFSTMEVFKHGIIRAYGKSYIKNLVFSQLNRHARNVKRGHFHAWSSGLFTISSTAIPPALEFLDTMVMDYGVSSFPWSISSGWIDNLSTSASNAAVDETLVAKSNLGGMRVLGLYFSRILFFSNWDRFDPRAWD